MPVLPDLRTVSWRSARGRRGVEAVLLLTTFAATGCYEQIVAPAQETDGRLTVTNDEEALARRVTYSEENVPIGGPLPAASGPSSSAPFLAPSSINLTLVAEAVPPDVGGATLQATSIWATADKKAIVSYGMIGAEALGALDSWTSLTNNKPQLKSSVTFPDSDMWSVFTDGTRVYAGGSTSDLSFATPGVMEKLDLNGNNFLLDNAVRMPLPSFAGTSATSAGGMIYATTGNTGGVHALDAGTLELLGEYLLDDARWVAADEANNRIVVLQGMPGRLSVFSGGATLNLVATYPVPGVDVAEAKNTVEVVGGKAFVAAGPAGVQVVCLDDGSIVGNIPRPDPASLGLDPSVVVTNAVTVQNDLLFISNGEAGVYAAAGADAFSSTPCDAPQQISVLGQLQFASLQSANHVVYRNNFLFVAAGLGGLKVVEVDVN